MSRNRPAPAASLPEVHFSDLGDTRYLHLGTPWVQGSMHMRAPNDIALEYVQRMMAWLLFVDPAGVAQRHAMQLGLGAGALSKFCRKKLHMRTTVVEINPQVVAACRGWFRLPAEDEQFTIVVGDAAVEVARPAWQGTVDALQVDLYDAEAAAPVLDDAGFYADCRRLLTPDGCMTVNLFGRDSSYDASVQKITEAFGADALWAFRPTREGNTIVLAQRTPERPARDVIAARAAEVEQRWGLPAGKWLRVFKPV